MTETEPFFSFDSIIPITGELQSLEQLYNEIWQTGSDAEAVHIAINAQEGFGFIEIQFETVYQIGNAVLTTLSLLEPNMHFRVLWDCNSQNQAGFRYFHNGRVEFESYGEMLTEYQLEQNSEDPDSYPYVNQFEDYYEDDDIQLIPDQINNLNGYYDYEQHYNPINIIYRTIIRQRHSVRGTLQLLFNINQIRCSPQYLITKPTNQLTLLQQCMQNGRFGTLDCSICSDTISTPFKLNCQCKFLYCYSCIQKWTSNNQTCPTCRSIID